MWGGILLCSSKRNNFFEKDERAEDNQAPSNKFHRFFSNARGHFGRDLTLALKAIDMPRLIHLTTAFEDAQRKDNDPDN